MTSRSDRPSLGARGPAARSGRGGTQRDVARRGRAGRRRIDRIAAGFENGESGMRRGMMTCGNHMTGAGDDGTVRWHRDPLIQKWAAEKILAGSANTGAAHLSSSHLVNNVPAVDDEIDAVDAARAVVELTRSCLGQGQHILQ